MKDQNMNEMEQGRCQNSEESHELPEKPDDTKQEEQQDDENADQEETMETSGNTHGDSLRHGHVYPIPIELLNPPRSPREKFRDFVLRMLDRPSFQVLGALVMIAIVVDGAAFFFFLMGWQTVCDTPSKTDCSPRNEIYNLTVQILVWLFTYTATVSMPWRCANAIQIFGCGIRDNWKGLDLYGRPTNEVWFHIDLCNRGGIIVCLVLNCLLQYANQATRIIFYNYELQDTYPGVYWVNIFFALSFVMGGVGALWSTICCERLRKQHPGRFGPGLAKVAKQYWRTIWSWVLCRQFQEEPSEGELDEYEEEEKEAEIEDDEDDPTHTPFNILGAQRAGLRLFGM